MDVVHVVLQYQLGGINNFTTFTIGLLIDFKTELYENQILTDNYHSGKSR